MEVYYSPASRKEYPHFFHTHLKPNHKRHKIQSVAPALRDNAIVVTGELGDQLFGSATALGLDFERLNAPWQSALPDLFTARLASAERATLLADYLGPQIARAPVPIPTLYECLWWLNFSMKWQPVSLRMIAGQPAQRFKHLRPRLAHFFQTDDFQRWALANPDKRIRSTWQSYKWPLRDYIEAFTGDSDYVANKQKEPSLKGMLTRPMKQTALAVTMAGTPLIQSLDDSLKLPLVSEVQRTAGNDETGISLEFSVERETPLWDDLDDGE